MGAIAGDELIRWENAQEEGGRGTLGFRENSTADGFIDGGGHADASSRSRGEAAGGKQEKIRVSVRLRPVNDKELARNDPSDWECINDTTIIFRNNLPERCMFPTAYTFDRVFRFDCTTKQVYEQAAKEVALSVVGGINATIFAYGQTSSGKTYTMTGITEYAANDIYGYIDKHKERAFVLKFSAMEIYNEAVKDLLSPENGALRLLDDPERGTTVEKLTEETLRDWDHMKQLLSICEAQRQIGETCLNETSSRSHQILRLTIESSAREFLGKENSSALAATVNFVDLAGSERASQALSAGTRLKEGCHINRSLLTLGTVIRKLSKGRNGHIPYRDSKLTRILQASLGGNARTAIICTLSPARSHVEQSRNTLLFASCAKEVVTSAQVNVVLSDKALVKHLQKELARLESELRYPRPTSGHSYTEALLKEKDAHIQKLEKEIKELNLQRDVAQSRILDLIKAVEHSQESRQWDGLSIHSGSHIPSVYDDELSIYDSSDVIDFAFLKSDASQGYACDSINYDKDYKEVLESSNRHNFASSINSVSGVTSRLLPGESTSILSRDGCQDMDDLCKEVRCIEIDMTSSRQDEQPNALLSEEGNALLPSSTYDNTHGSLEPITNHEGNKEMNFRKSIKQSLTPCPIFSSPLPPMQVLSSSRHLTSLPRSRSCRAILMNKSPSCWFLEEEQIANTPPSILFADFPVRREKPQRVLFSSNYSKENKVTLKDGSQASEQVVLINMSSEEVKPEAEEESSGKCHSAAEWKDMSQIQSQEELIDGQVDEEKDKRDVTTKSAKDISLDPTVNHVESPSDRLEEFEIHQRKIIELWHSCNVSLIHRTYFFLLFKGDPADSIYMEVELRRLDFLKRVFMKENADRSMVGHNVTLASSAKALRRERRMLCRYMQKRLSAEERESIYVKWGIPLRSKQRKMQITHLIWSKSGDIDHVRESALVVAQLIGLLEPDQALKEMFALNFTPQRFSGRSPSWKHGAPYLV